MSRARYIILCAPLVVLAACSSAVAPSSWLRLTRAYPARRDELIVEYTKSSVQSLRLYADALRDLASGRFDVLEQDGRACLAAPVSKPADAAAYFGCLWAVASGAETSRRPKLYFLWHARVDKFYLQHSKLVNAATQSDNPAAIKPFDVPNVETVAKWPLQQIAVQAGWSHIPFQPADHPTTTASVGDVRIPVLIDTGATGITMSAGVVRTYHLARMLVPLRAHSSISTNNGIRYGTVYYVRSFRLGPIEVDNAYVTVVPDDAARSRDAVVGVDILRALARFTISASGITRTRPAPSQVCKAMMFEREPVTHGGGPPFAETPTSAGPLGLYLDTGLAQTGLFSAVGLELAQRGWRRLASTENHADHTARGYLVTADALGRTKTFKTTMRDIRVAGIRTEVTFNNSMALVDPMVDGRLGFNFLKEATVSYDFPDRRICIHHG